MLKRSDYKSSQKQSETVVKKNVQRGFPQSPRSEHWDEDDDTEAGS